jgi:hypothetical protein
MEDPKFTARRLLNSVADRVHFRFADEQDRLNFQNRYGLTDVECTRLDAYRQRRERKEAKEERDRWIEQIQGRFANEAVEQFLDEYFKGAKDAEKRFIREQVSKEVKAPESQFDCRLEDLLKRGLPPVKKQIRKRRLKYLLHTWAGIKALISVAFVLLIYDKLQTDFEIIIYSIRIRLYTQLMRTTWWLSLTNASFNHAGYLRYVSLKQTLGYDIKPDEHRGAWDLEDGIKNSAIRFRVVDAGNSVINLIVYWHLIKLLL